MVSVGNRRSGTVVLFLFCVLLALLGIAAAMCSCNLATVNTAAPADVDALDKVRSLDIMPKQAEAVSTGRIDVSQRGRAAVYEGAEITDVADARMRPVATSGGGYALNFENTPIGTVAKVVLGDILGTGYTIDPRVQGTVSLVLVCLVSFFFFVFVFVFVLCL